MSNLDKQQKKGLMYIYKIGIRNQRKKELDHDVKKEKKFSSSISWLQKIRYPITRCYNQNHKELKNIGGGFVDARNSTSSSSCLELESIGGGGYVEGRKSVSCVEASTRGIIVEERRKSVSQIETLSSVIENVQVKVLVSDMPSFMQVNAFRCARKTYNESLDKFSSKHIAHNIKKEFDKAYGPVWHCIVGPSFGSFVTHSTGCFLYFSMESLYILLFKTKVKKTLD